MTKFQKEMVRAGAVIRAFVLAAAAVIFCWPLTVEAGLIAAGIGAAVGALTGQGLSVSRIRTVSFVVMGLVAGILGSSLADFLVTAGAPARAFGALETFALGEAVRWFFLVGPVALVLRMAAARFPAMAVLEVVAVSLAISASVAAHRDGMIHRPTALADWAWSRNTDPVVLLLVLGAAASFLLAGLMIHEQRKARLPLHFAILGLVALLLIFVIRLTGIPEPKAAGDLGLTGKPESGDQQKEAQGKSGGSGPQPPGKSGASGSSGGGSASQQMSDLQFKNEYSSSGNEAPVAIVVLHGDWSPPTGVYYFRQSAFSQFNGRRLVQATRDDVDRDLPQRFPSQRMEVPDAPPVSGERQALETTIGLMTDHVKPFALDSPFSLWPMQNPDRLRFRRAYAAQSHVLTLKYENALGHKAGRTGWTEEQWKHYTDGPVDPRYAELAKEIVSVLKPEYAADPLAQAVMIKEWLDKNGIYSRKSKHADADDPSASFLFGDRIGYCVHFAHAAAFLLRSVGVPARVGAGYAIPEGDRGEGSAIMIRGRSAHAWPEIYVDGVGWVVVDPSPERSLDPPDPSPDQGLQRMLGQMLRKSPGDKGEPEEQKPQRTSLAQMGQIALLILSAILLQVYAAKVYRAFAPRFVRPRQLYRVGYRAALDRLAEAGLKRGHAESRESFARRVGATAPAFQQLTENHLERALGGPFGPEAEEILRLSYQVGRQVRQNVPTWRWLLGALNPFSWISAR